MAEQDDWAGWYRDSVGREPDYSELVEELGGSPDERRSILEGYIEPTAEERSEGRKVPTLAHRAIADLVRDGLIRVLVTTNFDRLLENALRERGVEPTVVDSVDALQGAVPLTHAPCYLVKLHGDYKDARIRNTDGELADYPAALDALLDRIFDEHGVVVCGWSAEWDEALRRAMTRAPSRRYSLFWAVRGEPGDAARRIVEQRRGYFVPIEGADEFFGKLRDRVQTLVQTRRRDPRNVELLVNVAKRFVAKPQYRVELDDLLESEVEMLLARLRSSTSPASPDAHGIRVRTVFYYSSVEPLGRMAGALGRWGDGHEVDGVVNARLALVRQADEVRAGVTSLLYLRAYAAVIAAGFLRPRCNLRRALGSAAPAVVAPPAEGGRGARARGGQAVPVDLGWRGRQDLVPTAGAGTLPHAAVGPPVHRDGQLVRELRRRDRRLRGSV